MMTDNEILDVAHRMAWRYKMSSDPHHSDTYTFNATTMVDFARRVMAAAASEENRECYCKKHAPAGFFTANEPPWPFWKCEACGHRPRSVGVERKVMRIVSEAEFSGAIRLRLLGVQARAVVGPGRSGAVASVYASHILGIPFIPYGTECPEHLRPLLIVDTARKSGATLRKAERRYGGDCVVVHVFDEPPRLRFWYEPEAHNAEVTGSPALSASPCGLPD